MVRANLIRTKGVTLVGLTFATVSALAFGKSAAPELQVPEPRELNDPRFAGYRSLAWSVDGKLLTSRVGTQGVAVWDVKTGARPSLLTSHRADLNYVAFSPDAKFLAGATASPDNAVLLWELATGKEIRKLEGHDGPVHVVAYAPDGKMLASGGEDGTIRLWQAESGKELARLQVNPGRLELPVTVIAFLPDGKMLGSGAPFRAFFWDLDKRKIARTMTGLVGVGSLEFSADGKRLAVKGSGEARVYDVATNKAMFKLSIEAGASVTMSRDGKRLATASLQRGVQIWDTDTAKEVLTLHGRGPLAFSPDGKRLAGVGNEDPVRGDSILIWDLSALNARE